MKKLLYILIMIACCSCNYFGKEVGPTDIVVQDSIRHYFPIMQGEVITISFRVANIGKEPLVITDIHPSCGCISIDGEQNNIILPQKEQTFSFKFNSDKYTGFVQHNIYLYGNINNEYKMTILYFDINVVPTSKSDIDYEEIYFDQEARMDQESNIEKGYYINNGDYPEDYSTHYNKYPWRERKENSNK